MNKLVTSLVLSLSLIAIQMPMSAEAVGAEKEKRKTQLVSPSVGKKVAKAFEAYTAEDIDGAMVILKDISASKVFDKAYVTRFLAVMYAQKGDEVNSIKYLKKNLTHKYPNIVSDEIVNEWIYEQGLPTFIPKPRSTAFSTVSQQISQWLIALSHKPQLSQRALNKFDFLFEYQGDQQCLLR